MRRGLTLAELTVAVGVLGVVLLAGQSAVMLTSATAARSSKATTTAAACAAASATIGEELGAATRITSATATAITCVIPDRTGDGIEESLAYSWSGKAGDPLLRTLNGSQSTVLAGVQSLALSLDTQSRWLSAPATSAAETLLATNYAPADTNGIKIKDDLWMGFVFRPTLPSDATGWSVSRVALSAKKRSNGGRCEIQVRTVSNAKPASTVLASFPLADTDLTSDFVWKNFATPGLTGLRTSDSLSIVGRWIAANEACELQIQDKDPIPAGAMLYESINAGATWTVRASEALIFEVYGTITRPAAATQKGLVYRTLRIRATVKAPDTREIACTIPLLNEPPAP